MAGRPYGTGRRVSRPPHLQAPVRPPPGPRLHRKGHEGGLGGGGGHGRCPLRSRGRVRGSRLAAHDAPKPARIQTHRGGERLDSLLPASDAQPFIAGARGMAARWRRDHRGDRRRRPLRAADRARRCGLSPPVWSGGHRGDARQPPPPALRGGDPRAAGTAVPRELAGGRQSAGRPGEAAARCRLRPVPGPTGSATPAASSPSFCG